MKSIPVTRSNNKSVVLITVHKAGSVYVEGIVKRLLGSIGMPHVNMASEAYSKGIDEAQFCVANSNILSNSGYFFGAFRGPYIKDLKNLDRNKLVVHIRDPRDCIVSAYFSKAFSHPPPGGEARLKHMVMRDKLQNTDINEFVIERSIMFNRRFKVIIDMMMQYDDVYLSKYEDMVFEFSKWIGSLALYLGHDIPDDIIKSLISEANFSVVENKNKHVRQITPGDYSRKLRQETQEIITNNLRDVLSYFDYV